MLIKINPEKYIQLFAEWPHNDMMLSGWDWKLDYYLFGLIPIITYTKKLI